MIARQPTLIGRVRHILGARITAELNVDLAGTAPIFEGRIYHVGQIGSLVWIPQGGVDLVGAVTMLGIAELVTPTEPALIPQQGNRWVQFQLLGEIDTARRFRRGVTTYPAVDDPVHFATRDQIEAIYPAGEHGTIQLGTLSTSRGHTITLDLGKLVVRHSAVVGSTGSGKSSAVASVLQAIVNSGMERSNVVVIDPHGEYTAALPVHASVKSVLADGAAGLFVPYWALTFEELLQVYGRGAERNPVIRNRVHDLILEEKKAFLAQAQWPVPGQDDVTIDSPIPFDMRVVWHKLDYENRATYSQQNSQGNVCVLNAGDPTTLTPAHFQQYALGNAAPFRGRTFGHYNPLPDTVKARLTDQRFRFLCRTWPDPAQPDPLPSYLAAWLGDNQPISVLDFSGVPSEAADIAIGAVLKLLFVAALNSSPNDGVGRARPLLIVLEEAHRFLGKGAATSASFAREAAERIAREGRKYGVGLMIVSQRPSEISDTVLSQCGTVVSMRLSNISDQNTIRAALPDVIAGLVDVLPALRTGEAVITGEAIALPSRVAINRPNPEPHAADPQINAWEGAAASNDLTNAIARWRGALQEPQQPEE